jgi:glycosyltransferase involved in cell wall biosynthesis
MARERSGVLIAAHLRPKRRGALEEQFAAIGRTLAARAVPVTVALDGTPTPSVAKLLGDAGVEVAAVDYAAPWTAAVAIARLIARRRPLIAHLHFVQPTAPLAIAASLAGAQVVVNYHLSLGEPAARGRAVLRAKHAALSLARRLGHPAARVAVSRHVAAFVAAAEDVPLESIRVIENGIDLERFAKVADVDPASARARFGLPGPLIGCVARLTFEKGVDVAISALARLRAEARARLQPPPSLLVAGDDGPEAPRCRALVEMLGLGDAVRFLGVQDRVEDVLAACDQVWVPSLVREAFGLAAAEAMAAGRPVIASHVGGLPEVVLDGATGRLVPPGDPAALALAAGELLFGDPAATRRLVAGGQARARARFGLDRYVREVVALYSQLEETQATTRSWVRRAPASAKAR